LSAEAANDGLWDWDLASGSIYFSSRWKSMLGYQDNDIGNDPDEWFSRIQAKFRQHIQSDIQAHIRELVPKFEHEYLMTRKDGSDIWILTRGIIVNDKNGIPCRIAGSQTDITERKIASEQILHDALHDALTNLPNRTLFMDRLTHVMDRSIRSHQENNFAVLFVDLDHFKMINDSMGHLAGDKLLILVSQRLKKSLRPGDTVARFGGDEFVILLEEIQDIDTAVQLTSRIRNDFTAPFQIDDHEIFVTVSVGVSYHGEDNREGSTVRAVKPEDLLRNADIAMYRAKSNGRNRYEIFTMPMYEHVIASNQMATDLRRAVSSMDFELYYQPVYSIGRGRLTGFEALIRWEHPILGFVSPEEFIPLAEQAGLINEIGDWVLIEACQQIRKWQQEFTTASPLTVSVNVSTKQLLPRLITQVKNALRETGIAPQTLALEITETSCMENQPTTLLLIEQLKCMDVQIHIDDFGTGYSSLSYLHKFPIDVLKIDRSFISEMHTNRENYEIVKTIRKMAKTLNMAVTAEGVENAEQASMLAELECSNLQGYLISKPLSVRDMSERLPGLLEGLDSEFLFPRSNKPAVELSIVQ
jgi:diguanylate cyclase (GGDEF)-like protein/PAS domain S-box-containing protein